VHLPKLPIESILKYIPRLHEPAAPDVKIYFETPAVSPKESYYETPLKQATLFHMIPSHMNVGLCIDTAHIWTCGVDISTYALASRYLADLEMMRQFIPERSIMFHLNDSQRPLGVGPDTHEALTRGQIWHGAESGLNAFINYIVKHNNITILERKADLLRNDYQIIKELAYDTVA
jgi:endonuclease IV